MIKNKKLIQPLLLALCMASVTSVYAVEEAGRLYMPITDLPAELIGHAPGIRVSVKTDNQRNDGFIYSGNTLTINYKILDTDLDWAEPGTQEDIEKQIYWYYVKSDGNGGFVIDGDVPIQLGGVTYQVKPEDIGKMIGISIFAETTTGTPNISDRLEAFDLKNTYVLVPEGQEKEYNGQQPGTIFNVGPVIEDNNITDVVIRDCPVGETCGGVIVKPENIDIALYQNVAAPGEPYDYQEISITQATENLRVKTWYAVKVFAMKEDTANPGQLIRSDVDLTEQYKDKIEWALVDSNNPANKHVIKATYNPLADHKQMEFKTQKFNDDQSPDGQEPADSLAQSGLHGSQQGMKFQFTVDF